MQTICRSSSDSPTCIHCGKILTDPPSCCDLAKEDFNNADTEIDYGDPGA